MTCIFPPTCSCNLESFIVMRNSWDIGLLKSFFPNFFIIYLFFPKLNFDSYKFKIKWKNSIEIRGLAKWDHMIKLIVVNMIIQSNLRFFKNVFKKILQFSKMAIWNWFWKEDPSKKCRTTKQTSYMVWKNCSLTQLFFMRSLLSINP